MKPTLLLTLILSLLLAPASLSAAPDGGGGGAVLSGETLPPNAPAGETKAPRDDTKKPGDEAKDPAGETKSRDGERQSWWQALLVDVIKATLAIFVPVLSVLLFALLRKIGLKVDLETLDALGGKAALYAEKKAASALGEGKPKSPSAEKERWAWEFVESVDARFGGSEKARRKLRAMILAKIPEAEAAVAASKPNGEPS